MQIPQCLSHLPLHGALPIPWSTPMHQGRPNFRATDLAKHNMSVRFGLCGVCGKHIAAPPYTFLVGPVCIAEGFVFGTPLHAQCARAALTLCPFLSRWEWERSEVDPGLVQIVPREELPPKPTRPGLATLDAYTYQEGPLRGLYTRLPQPLQVQWWSYKDGVLVPEETEAKAI